MRILYGFATGIGVAWVISELVAGPGEDFWIGLLIALGAGALLWRDLRNPAFALKGGEQAKIKFHLQPGPGLGGNGTYARVDTYRDAAWNVVIDRPPERVDFDIYDMTQTGWVWLDETGLPRHIRINKHSRWQSWPVLDAAPIDREGQSQ